MSINFPVMRGKTIRQKITASTQATAKQHCKNQERNFKVISLLNLLKPLYHNIY